MWLSGDLSEEMSNEDEKPLDSVALTKFLSKAAVVTTVIFCCSRLNFQLRSDDDDDLMSRLGCSINQ